MPSELELLGKIEALKLSSIKDVVNQRLDQRLVDLADLKLSSIKDVVDQRLAEFKAFRTRSSHDNFKELCFCILTGNCGAEASLKLHAIIGNRFLTCSCPEEFTMMLKDNGGRFYNNKGKFLGKACQFRETLKATMDSFGDDEIRLREWLVEHIDGFGYKESSHFMRNVGYEHVAIIDFHIVDLLVDNGLIERPKTLSKKKYLEIEQVLHRIARAAGLHLGALDLYLWYMETGAILK